MSVAPGDKVLIPQVSRVAQGPEQSCLWGRPLRRERERNIEEGESCYADTLV